MTDSAATLITLNLIGGVGSNGVYADNTVGTAVVFNAIGGYGEAGVRFDNSEYGLIAYNYIHGFGGYTPEVPSEEEPQGPQPEYKDNPYYEGEGEYYPNENFGEGTVGIQLGTTGNFNGSSNIAVIGNTVVDNRVGFEARALNNGYIDLEANRFTNNTVGSWIGSGLIDLTSPVTGQGNTFTGGDTAMIFENPYYPSFGQEGPYNPQPIQEGEGQEGPWMPYGYTGLQLVGDTLGAQVFQGQTNYYVDLRNGAFFNPGNPTIIDGTQATYDGVSGGLMTYAQYLAIEAKLNDFDDNTSLGQIFAGFFFIDDNQVLKKILANGYKSGKAGVIVTGLPKIGNLSGGPNFFTLQDLANLAPAAGGNDSDPSTLTVDELANLAPAAGGDDTMTPKDVGPIVNGACWGAIGQGKITTIDLSDDSSAMLSDMAKCQGL